MNKKIMTVNELYSFCLTNKFFSFNSNDSGTELIVQMKGNFQKSNNTQDKLTEGLTPIVSRAFHDHTNLNKSSIEESVFVDNVPSSHLRPILANIVLNKETNELDFGSHDYHVEEIKTIDENGNEVFIKKTVYDEQPIGVIDGSRTTIEFDEDAQVNRAILHGFLYNDYCQDAIDILNKRGTVDCSIELFIRDMSFDPKSKILILNDFYVSALTLLGANYKPGMEGSNVSIEDFSTKNNSIKFDKNEKMIELLESIDKKLSDFNKNNLNVDKQSKEGGNKELMLEKLLEKYNKTIEDITFEYENLSDEELEAKFTEMFDNKQVNDLDDKSVNSISTDNGNQNESVFVRSFELSHSDIRSALYVLLEPFEESDNEWYWISDVYDDYFIYENYGDKIYRQNYTKDNETNVVAFDGERIELFKELLTASEKAELESMRANYSVLKEFKETTEKNQLHAQKEDIINSETFSLISTKNENGEYENTEFSKLVSEMDNYSLEDLEKEAKVILADYMTSNQTFSLNKNTNTVSNKTFSTPDKKSVKSNRYGNLFKK